MPGPGIAKLRAVLITGFQSLVRYSVVQPPMGIPLHSLESYVGPMPVTVINLRRFSNNLLGRLNSPQHLAIRNGTTETQDRRTFSDFSLVAATH